MTGASPAANADSREPTAPGRVATRRRRGARIAIGLALLVICALLADLAVLSSRIDSVHVSLPSEDDDVDTWVIIGSDSRGHAPSEGGTDAFGTSEQVPGERADLIILITVTDDDARAVSVPRDLLVAQDGYPKRLGMTFQDGGQALVDALCTSLKVPVDHLVGLHFDGFVAIVDALGGLDVTLEHAVRDPLAGLDLPAGAQRIDGLQALALVRSRSSEQLVDGSWQPTATGVEDRAEWGSLVLKALMRRASDERFSPFVVQRAAWAATGALWTDEDTGLLDLLSVARSSPGFATLPHDPPLGTAPPGGAVPLPPNAATTDALHEMGVGRSCAPRR